MNLQSPFRDTIFALSSGSTPSGVAVIRLSGPNVRHVLETSCGAVPLPRRAAVQDIVNTDGETLDRAIVLFFEGPASFTGEDSGEFQLHGGRATVAAVLSHLGSMTGLRMADAGEFTRRAFINGKIDLTGAEALSDLIAAETESQRRLALENASGGQHRLYSDWRRRLLHARAMIEAELDFADEGDVPESVSDRVWRDMQRLADDISAHIGGFRSAEIAREGFRVVLVGAPNAGKSSLLNALARRDVAIVTDQAGTTRDLIEVALDLGGVKVVLIDTAGLRDSDDEVERIGIERARSAAERADLVLKLEEPAARTEEAPDIPANASYLCVGTKSDIVDSRRTRPDFRVSALTGDGLPELLREIERRAAEAAQSHTSTLPSRLRHVDLLKSGLRHLHAAIDGPDAGIELRAEELRLAEMSLGRIIGTVDVDDLLGEIFSRFCVGK